MIKECKQATPKNFVAVCVSLAALASAVGVFLLLANRGDARRGLMWGFVIFGTGAVVAAALAPMQKKCDRRTVVVATQRKRNE